MKKYVSLFTKTEPPPPTDDKLKYLQESLRLLTQYLAQGNGDSFIAEVVNNALQYSNT